MQGGGSHSFAPVYKSFITSLPAISALDQEFADCSQFVCLCACGVEVRVSQCVCVRASCESYGL